MSITQYQREASAPSKKPSFKLSYYRKIIASGGMVQFTLGLGFVMFWIFVPSVVFNVDMALGICFLLSGVISFFCGNFRSLPLAYTTMVFNLLTIVLNVALLVLIVYHASEKSSNFVLNPSFSIFLVYFLFGIGFSFLSAKYSFLASKMLGLKTKVEREISSDFSTGVTPATNVTAAPQGFVTRRHQQALPMARIVPENANTNSNVNADLVFATTSSI